MSMMKKYNTSARKSACPEVRRIGHFATVVRKAPSQKRRHIRRIAGHHHDGHRFAYGATDTKAAAAIPLFT